MEELSKLYDDLSSYYDQFCSHVNYEEQSDFAYRAFNCFAKATERNYLDLACGTGQHLKLMAEKGFTVTGLDNSSHMLDQAAIRCPQANLLRCDLAEFDFKETFDLITCFLYSIHYSHPTASLIETLKRAYAALKTGGIFIFDMVDKNGIANDSGVIARIDHEKEKLTFQSRWWYRGEGDVLDLLLSIERQTTERKIDVEEKAAALQKWNDHHIMTAVEISQISLLMKQIGFDITVFDRNYDVFTEWDGLSSNVIVVGTK